MKRDFETMKPVLDALASRYSCRAFADRPIPDEVLDALLDTALRAASGGNLQPVSVILVKDPARKKALRALCDDQPFIETAAVNLVFCMDWHRYAVYTRAKEAPFVANRSFGHFLIALEDAVCMAQTVESAAFLCGIGSCYVGSVANYIRPVSDFLKLPDQVMPVLLLCLGYPKQEPKGSIPKLKRNMMVCEEAYTPYTREEIIAAYDEKFAGRTVPLPKDPATAEARLLAFFQNLLTTYPEEEAKAIVENVRKAGCWNETQRRFGLHYEAAELLETGRIMQRDMAARDLDIFTQTKRKEDPNGHQPD